MIVRWGLEELPGLLDELGIARPFLIASDRWSWLDLPAAPLHLALHDSELWVTFGRRARAKSQSKASGQSPSRPSPSSTVS